jgi:hypothetical protein
MKRFYVGLMVFVACLFAYGFANAYPIVVDGNDSLSSIVSATEDDCVYLLAKYEYKNKKWSFNGGVSETFNISGSSTSGEWNTDPKTSVYYMSVKASNKYALYEFNPSQTNGSWSTELLSYKDVSHISFWSTKCPPAVPIPAAIYLLGSGIVGIICFKRKRHENKTV